MKNLTHFFCLINLWKNRFSAMAFIYLKIIATNVLKIGLVKLRLMSKRIKINFETINKGKYEIIPPKEIAESNARIKKAMNEFIRKLKRK